MGDCSDAKGELASPGAMAPCQREGEKSATLKDSKIARLTSAENRVLVHLSQAKTNKEIAATLGISPATVKRHMEKIMTKLNLRNRVEAAIYGLLSQGCPLQSRPSCVLRAVRDGGAVSDDESFDTA